MTAYVSWVQNFPSWSAAVQFALLGTLGEVVAVCLQNRRFALPGTWWETLAKVGAWALLGVVIKYGFAGMQGFTTALQNRGMLPDFTAVGWGRAFAVSVFTNLFFGPQMMFFHRLEDNLILRQRNFSGLTTAWWTLLWFWIPAHTITFFLPRHYQIGLAALWSLILGLIMGLTRSGRAVEAETSAIS